MVRCHYCRKPGHSLADCWSAPPPPRAWVRSFFDALNPANQFSGPTHTSATPPALDPRIVPPLLRHQLRHILPLLVRHPLSVPPLPLTTHANSHALSMLLAGYRRRVFTIAANAAIQ